MVMDCTLQMTPQEFTALKHNTLMKKKYNAFLLMQATPSGFPFNHVTHDSEIRLVWSLSCHDGFYKGENHVRFM